MKPTSPRKEFNGNSSDALSAGLCESKIPILGCLRRPEAARFTTKEGAPKGPLCFTEMGFGPPPIPRLLEERHDLVDYAEECSSAVLPALDEIATLLGVQVEEHELASGILVDQLCAVA